MGNEFSSVVGMVAGDCVSSMSASLDECQFKTQLIHVMNIGNVPGFLHAHSYPSPQECGTGFWFTSLPGNAQN